MGIIKKQFGTLPDGRTADLLKFDNGTIEIGLTNYGGIITQLIIPDKSGMKEDIILGFDELKGYINDTSFHAALIGRYGNRIRNAAFTLDGKEYKLSANEGNNHLHGGNNGFNRVLWDYKEISGTGWTGIELSYLSKDGEEGYPGNVTIIVEYRLTNDNELILDYTATTDRSTIINLTHHGYFNLNGTVKNIHNHLLKLHSNRFLPADDESIPSGSVESAEGTGMDFTDFARIGDNLQKLDDEGIDNTYLIDRKTNQPELAAEVYDPDSGRFMEVMTTEPGVQLYTANHFDGSVRGKNGNPYQKHDAFCLETQHYPNSPNQPDFPSTILRPGDVYKQKTIFRFSIKDSL